MNIMKELEQEVKQAFDQVGLSGFSSLLRPTKNTNFGDYQINGAMAAAKQRGESAVKLGNRLIDALSDSKMIAHAEVVGPGFVNLFLNDHILTLGIDRALSDTRLNIGMPLQDETVIIDYSSPNLAKEMHVGHLRSTIIGDSLRRIYGFLGAQTIAQNHVGDWGTQMGMLVALIMEQKQNDTQLLLSDLEDFYRQAKKRFDQDEDFAQHARECVVKLQAGDEEIKRYWRNFLTISLKHMQAIYDELDITLTSQDIHGESEYNDLLPQVVKDLLNQGIAQEDQGTKLIYLDSIRDENGNPEVFIIQKKDGGYLYATTDLAALRQNIRKWHPDRLLYVVDSRQSLYFKALFEISHRAHWLSSQIKAIHVTFGTMMNQDGKPFKTRDGGTVKLDHLLKEAIQKAQSVVLEKEPNLSQEEVQKIAKTVGIAAIKYADLSKNRLSDYVFDLKQMLSLEGNTAPYLQYAYARVQSVLLKAGEQKWMAPYHLHSSLERRLALLLLQFEEVLLQVIEHNSPHYLAIYLYQVATLFSHFYSVHSILNEEEYIRNTRLALTFLTGRVLQQGLNLLGISVLERM